MNIVPQNRKEQLLLMYIIIGWVFLYFLLSIFLFAQSIPFSISTIWISSLGNPALGTNSIYAFNPGTLIAGAMLMIHALYYFRKREFHWKITRFALQLLMSGGIIGFGMIGIFTDNIQPIHDIMAGFAFGGLFLAYFWLDLLFMVKKLRTEPGKTIVVGATFLFLIIGVSIFIIGGINYHNTGNWIIIWEWIALFALGLNIVVLILVENLDRVQN